ncbi:MAG: anhydro-N-acetylmuramic acid kinase [Gemmataceae bacterium]|nr:anhydro-N-acetylmuramic acid kinase [Gemmataceae bacterium]
MTTRWFIGLTPGSTIDGIDAALLETQGVGLDLRVRLLKYHHQPYSPELRALIRQAATPGAVQARQISLLHRVLGETLAAAARHVADAASFSLPQALCISCPGQCVWQESEGRFPSALELGMPAVVAERTGVTCVSDFRCRDLAAGGQAVPLHAIADYLLFRHAEENRLLLHLGGLASAVLVPAGGRVSDVMGIEAGPCTLLLDGIIHELTGGRETHDTGGKHAVQGRCIDAALEHWLGHPYWHRRPPRSLSFQAFTAEFVTQARQLNGSLHDVLCTATHLVARGLAATVRKFLPPGRVPPRVLLSGGGVRNGFLWHLLQQQLDAGEMARTDSVGVPAEARKAIAFGILGALAVDGVPSNVPSITGASGARLLGSLTPGSPANWARCVTWMAGQMMPTLSRAS